MANIPHDAPLIDVHVQAVGPVVHGLHAVGRQHAVLRRQVGLCERRAAVRVRERFSEEFGLPVVGGVGITRGGGGGDGVLKGSGLDWVAWGNGERLRRGMCTYDERHCGGLSVLVWWGILK